MRFGVRRAGSGISSEEVFDLRSLGGRFRCEKKPIPLMLSVFSDITTYLQPFAELFQLRSVRRLSSITSANWRWFANAVRSNRAIQIREAVELEVTKMAADRFPQTNATTSALAC